MCSETLTDRERTAVHYEITSIFRRLRTSKAARTDGIQNAILQHLPQKVLKFIAKVFNISLALYYFPVQLKGANIITLQKPGKDHTSLLHHRSTSPLNSPGKLHENIVFKTATFKN